MIENLIQQHQFGEEWLKRTNTGFLTRPVSLGSPIIKQIFRRSYIQIARDVFFLSVFAEYLVKDKEQVRKVQEILRNSLNKASKALENRVTQLQAVAAQSEVDTSLTFTQQLVAETPLTTPISKGLLDLFVAGDKLHGLAQACWIEGAIPDDEKRNLEEELKKVLRTFLRTVRTMMGTTLSAMRRQRQQGTLSPEAMAELEEATTHLETETSEDIVEGEVDADAMREAEEVFAKAGATEPVPEVETA